VAAPAVETTKPAEGGGSEADLGAQVFAKRCVLCHGVDGHGDGIAAKGLNPKPRNFHDQAYMKTRTDAQLLEVIHKGKGAMPRWEGQLSEAEIRAVLAHVRALGAKP
jgi:mono/diheme cytochrome c family protein